MKYFNSVLEIIPWIRGAGGSLINLKGEEALAELEAIVARDADVRTLDEWAARNPFAHDWGMHFDEFGGHHCMLTIGPSDSATYREYTAGSADAARREAATWVRSC